MSNPLGRPCTVCTHNDAALIDANLAAGASVATVAAEFHLSESAVYRHRHRHLSRTLLQEARATATMATGDLLSRLADVLDDLTASRSASLLSGNSVGVVRAAAAEVRAIETLLTKLGVDDAELAREYAQAEGMARAIGAVVRSDPDEFGATLVTELRHRNLIDAATAVQRQVDLARAIRSTTTSN